MEKKILLPNGNYLIISIKEQNGTNVVIVNEYYQEDNNSKVLTLSLGEDIEFSVAANMDGLSELNFSIDFNHPLYFCFNRFLENESEITIDDDNTQAPLERYITISRQEKAFNIKFVNKQKTNDSTRVFIKSIGPDPQNKIEDYSTKIRIIRFLREIERTLLEEFHQITIDEYLETLKQQGKIKTYSFPKNIELERKNLFQDFRFQRVCANCFWSISPEMEDNILEEQGYDYDDETCPHAGDCCLSHNHQGTYTCESFDYEDTIKEEIEEIRKKLLLSIM